MIGGILRRGEDVKSQQDCRFAVPTERAPASSVRAVPGSEAEEEAVSISALSKHVANETSALVQPTESSGTPSNVTLASMQLDAGQGAGDIEIKEQRGESGSAHETGGCGERGSVLTGFMKPSIKTSHVPQLRQNTLPERRQAMAAGSRVMDSFYPERTQNVVQGTTRDPSALFELNFEQSFEGLHGAVPRRTGGMHRTVTMVQNANHARCNASGGPSSFGQGQGNTGKEGHTEANAGREAGNELIDNRGKMAQEKAKQNEARCTNKPGLVILEGVVHSDQIGRGGAAGVCGGAGLAPNGADTHDDLSQESPVLLRKHSRPRAGVSEKTKKETSPVKEATMPNMMQCGAAPERSSSFEAANQNRDSPVAMVDDPEQEANTNGETCDTATPKKRRQPSPQNTPGSSAVSVAGSGLSAAAAITGSGKRAKAAPTTPGCCYKCGATKSTEWLPFHVEGDVHTICKGCQVFFFSFCLEPHGCQRHSILLTLGHAPGLSQRQQDRDQRVGSRGHRCTRPSSVAGRP